MIKTCICCDSYETGNGIKVSEAGVVKHVTGLRSRSDDPNAPDEEDILVHTGAFSYTAPDGQVISLRYLRNSLNQQVKVTRPSHY